MYRRNGRKHFLLFLLRVSFWALGSERERRSGARREAKEDRREGAEQSPVDVRGRQKLPVPRSNVRSRRCHTVYERPCADANTCRGKWDAYAYARYTERNGTGRSVQ